MSEDLDPAADAHTNPSATEPAPNQKSPTGTHLRDFPRDATFRVWRKPKGKDAVLPLDGGEVHIGELIPGHGDHVLICFGNMLPSGWEVICRGLENGKRLELKPLLVAALDKEQVGCGLWGAKELAGLHGITNTPTHPMVFSPSKTLMRLLKIDRGTRTRNALVLIRNGHICAEWISSGDGDKPHDWTKIQAMVS